MALQMAHHKLQISILNNDPILISLFEERPLPMSLFELEVGLRECL